MQKLLISYLFCNRSSGRANGPEIVTVVQQEQQRAADVVKIPTGLQPHGNLKSWTDDGDDVEWNLNEHGGTEAVVELVDALADERKLVLEPYFY